MSSFNTHASTAFQADKFAEWMGSGLGILGALVLAVNTEMSRYGWLMFLLSNAFWIFYAWRKGIRSLLMMQLVFTATSLIGISRWFF
jgi:hypothetical protein